jgi:hypothetical protein
MSRNFYNYAAGFQAADYIPVRCFNDWYARMVEKLKNDPSAGFLLKGD